MLPALGSRHADAGPPCRSAIRPDRDRARRRLPIHAGFEAHEGPHPDSPLAAPAGAKWTNVVVERSIGEEYRSTATPFGRVGGEDWVIVFAALVRHPGGETRFPLAERADCCSTSESLLKFAQLRFDLKVHPRDPAVIQVIRSDGDLVTLVLSPPTLPVYCTHWPSSALSWDVQGSVSRSVVRDVLGTSALPILRPNTIRARRATRITEGRAAVAVACAEPDDAEFSLALLEWHLLTSSGLTQDGSSGWELSVAERRQCLERVVRKHDRARQRLYHVLRAGSPSFTERDSFAAAARALALADEEASQVVLAQAARDALASDQTARDDTWEVVHVLADALAQITQTRRRAPELARAALARIAAWPERRFESRLEAARRRGARPRQGAMMRPCARSMKMRSDHAGLIIRFGFSRSLYPGANGLPVKGSDV